MIRYTFKRILLLIPILVGVSLFIFLAMDMAQGDYVDFLVNENTTPEQEAELRAKYGLDKPAIIRYFDYMGGMFRGDLGTSYLSGESVFDSFMHKIGNTTKLAIASTIVCVAISLPLGIYSAKHRGTIRDNISQFFAVLGLSIPNFWLGLMLIILFALKLGWLPSGGDEGFRSIILPALTVGTGHTAILMRTTRSSMLDTLNADYLRTARAKGLLESTVVNKHALKPAMIPILQVALSQFAACFGGASLTETVFSWPGVGKMIVDAVKQRDTPLVCGSLILKCTIISVIGLITDLLYVAVDPRVKTQYASSSHRKKKKTATEEEA